MSLRVRNESLSPLPDGRDQGAEPRSHTPVSGGWQRGKNPYAGPRSLCYGEPIYGRNREKTELLDLLIAERIVLLHSPSGAGKTSLIEAALRGDLEEEGFDVLPMIRVGRASANLKGVNPYVLSTLQSLEQKEGSKKPTLSVEKLASMDLDSYLRFHEENHPIKDGTVLIFDQFEEILTHHALDECHRREFFEQISIALRAPHRWALFAMREDYLGALLDPYAEIIPTRFKNTFRLDLLTYESASEAIKEPARSQGVDFTDDAVKKLVDDLRQVAVWDPAKNTTERRPGRYVEPVQLQVVCYSLWDKPDPDSPQDINAEEIASMQDVDKVLGDFYAASVERIGRESGGCEREIRRWFDNTLITESGIRAQVQLASDSSRGFPDEVIGKLQDVHLIRGEDRRGTTWLELSHDRLVKPIQENNAEWATTNLNVLQRQAEAWHRQNRPESLYLNGRELAEARNFAKRHPDKLLGAEKEFLRKSRDSRRTAVWRIIGWTLIPIAIVISGLALYGFTLQTANAKEQEANAKGKEAIAKEQAAIATEKEAIAQHQTKLANIQAMAAQEQAAIAKRHKVALKTATQSLYLLDDKLDLALLLAQQAMKITPDVADARGALFSAVLHNPRLLKFRHEHEQPGSAIAASRDGKMMASGDYGGNVLLWDVADGGISPRQVGRGGTFWKEKVADDVIRCLAFSPDGKTLAVGSKDGSLTLLEFVSYHTKELISKDAGKPNIWSVAFHGSWLISAADSGEIKVWETTGIWEGGAAKLTPFWKGEFQNEEGKTKSARTVAVSGDGRYLAAGGQEVIRVWKRQGVGTEQTWKPDGTRLVDEGSRVNCLAFRPGPGDVLLAAGTLDANKSGEDNRPGSFHLFNLSNPDHKKVGVHQGQITALAFDPKGDQIATASYDGTIQLWKGLDFVKEGPPFKGHSNWVLCLAFWRHPDQNGPARMATGGIDRKLIHWNPDRFLPMKSSRKAQGEPAKKFTKFQYTFSPDGLHEASGYETGAIQLLRRNPDTLTHQPRKVETSEHALPVTQIRFSKDGSLMIVCRGENGEGGVCVYDLSGPEVKLIREFPVKEGVPSAVAMSPDKLLLVVGTEAGRGLLYDLKEDKPEVRVRELRMFTTRTGTQALLSTLDFSPDGKRIVGAGSAHFIAVWDVSSGELERVPPDGEEGKEHQGSIRSVTFSPKSPDLVVTTSSDSTVALWNMKERKRIGAPLLGHSSDVFHAVFSPNGKLLATASKDFSVLLWDVETHRRLDPPLLGHLDAVRALSFNKSGTRLFSGSYVNGVPDTLSWNLDAESWQEQCKARVNRNLTRAEWKTYVGEDEPYELLWPELGEPKE